MQDRVDVLNRDGFVNKIFNIINVITENKKNCSFAIDGKWGSGKTFVLKLLQEKLEIEQLENIAGDKYFVCYYDCWKYDYYEEPVISIITSILQELDSKQNIVSEKTKDAVLDKTKHILKEIVCSIAKNKYGIDIDGVMSAAFEKKEQYINYDKYFGFQQELQCVRDAIQQIANIMILDREGIETKLYHMVLHMPE